MSTPVPSPATFLRWFEEQYIFDRRAAMRFVLVEVLDGYGQDYSYDTDYDVGVMLSAMEAIRRLP